MLSITDAAAITACGPHPARYDGVSQALRWLVALAMLASQWAVYALIVAHVAGAAYHVAVRRDELLDGMLPSRRS